MAASPLSRLDPRASLGAAVGWTLLAVSLAIALAAGLWAAQASRTAVLAARQAHLRAVADEVAAELSQGIVLRQQALQATAAILAQRTARGENRDTAALLDDIRHTYPELATIEAFDRDQHRLAVSRAKGEQDADLRGRFVALVSPIRDAADREIGLVSAQLDWAWVDALGLALTPDLNRDAGEEWLVVDEHGRVQIASAGARVGTPFSDDDKLLVVPARPSSGPALSQLGWRVLAAQPLPLARRDADATGLRIFVTIVALGMVGGALGLPLGRRLTRRIAMIADSAERMLADPVRQLDVPPGRDEPARLGGVLAQLVSALAHERDALRRLNAELDERVAARTREIERLAEESRYAATVRERLRLARDLHDTLGHSMMAMLAQIRLLKRIAASDPAALPAELAQAEQAAQKGLDEARTAITQLRFNAVRDVGLGASLGEYLKRFGERTGIGTKYSFDPLVADFAEASAETLFRMVEEGLRNVERHAGADMASLALAAGAEGELLTITLTDNGRGFDPQAMPPGHYGLVGMREQAALIGAQVVVDSAPGRGTRIVISVPRHAGQ